MKLNKYWRLWLKTSQLSLQNSIATRGASLMFIIGKTIRFFFYLTLLFIVLRQTKVLAGYNLNQIIIFFLIFEIIDIVGQLFFRGIYFFRNEVITGHFDLTLVKPANVLFQVLTAQTDLLDTPLLIIVFYLFTKLNFQLTLANLILFIFLFVSGFILITAIHIIVASIGVITTEVDHVIWIYRDLSLMCRVPIDIYLDSVRNILTFIIPMAIIFTFPAKALMGLLAWPWLIYSLIASCLFLFISLKFWQFSLTKYSSASS